MAPLSQKKRKLQDGMRGNTQRPKKRFRKQLEYHSSSEDSDGEDKDFAAVNLNDSDEEVESRAVSQTNSKAMKQKHSEIESEDGAEREDPDEESDQNTSSDDDDDDDDEEESNTAATRKPPSKRNNPEAFSTSISKILSTKLSQSARKDPVLSRSREAAEISISLANERLEKKAKAKLRSERKEDLERGRIKDVLGLNSGQAGEIAEEEKRLRKIAQRGVVKLFNAVRAAQVKGEQAAKEERKKGTIGMANREEKVNEMSKQSFLDLIGGKSKTRSTSVP
ncbi:uncharacterized protein Z518_00236 [Rhinocladiella mackenziei CBS 650.93]|uniref:Ribosomal RNA-processing protein 15 n=1 Tax=Rhinocladiella mackenziei CBS 650.93 TaxID=1442369 RepID=A0A0D2HES8_9EURO|nr:uncharacterized protein Z518_00236 [Rhinocladiella mackenziei CBS 650.93]KIX09158.1 hypothetical protein Z518_00236 [Rhinocladiella mackenziei CBS 650.93]